MSEFKDALIALETSVKAENKTMIEKSLETLEADFGKKLADSSTEVKTIVTQLVEAAEETLLKQFNELSATLKTKSVEDNAEPQNFTSNLKSFLGENIKSIAEVTKGKSVQFGVEEMKAVGNMLTTGDHVTGDYIRDYNKNVITLPGQSVNVADLIPTVKIEGGTYTFIRETAQEGAVAYQNEGSDKALLDSDFAHIDVTTDFLAGRTVYSKKMRNNLSYLQSFLPVSLRKRYFIAENADFYTKIAAAATASAELAAGSDTKAEQINKELATLEAANYEGANAIVMTVADWYAIVDQEKSTGAGYGLPIGWSYSGNTLRAYGVPVVKANWMPTNKYLVGNFSMIEKIVTEGLSLEFSDQERFSKNEIVARIEAQVGLAVKEPSSIILGDFTQA